MRKVKLIFSALIIFSFIFSSCSNNTNELTEGNIEISDEDAKLLDDERICQEAIDTSTGTVCCTLGFQKVSPGETLIYEYRSNYTIETIEWEIISGSITIIEGGNTSNAKLKFGDDFDGGQIVARSISVDSTSGSNVNCGNSLTISLK